MPTVYCTHKMAKWLGSIEVLQGEPKVENTWNANLFKVERINWLGCVHNPTGYFLAFPKVKKAELAYFDQWFYPRLVEQCRYDGIAEELIEAFPIQSNHFFQSNNHRRTLGILTNRIKDLKFYIPYWTGRESINLLEIIHRMNEIPIGRAPHWPIAEMEAFLMDCKADI